MLFGRSEDGTIFTQCAHRLDFLVRQITDLVDARPFGQQRGVGLGQIAVAGLRELLADGTVRAETKGVVGPSCLDQIAVLEDLLEATTVTSEFTPDYHRTTVSDTAEDIDELYH